MNDNDKLKQILTNAVTKCDGIHFYRISINGQSANIWKQGALGVTIELENTGEQILICDITDVTFDSDIYFAEFKCNYESYGVDIMRDMSPQEIINELL